MGGTQYTTPPGHSVHDYDESNSWSESSASNEYKWSSRYTSNTNRWARWIPTIPANGDYEVYIWYDYWSTRDTNAKYTIKYAGGTDTFRWNQKQLYSQWRYAGTYTFTAGNWESNPAQGGYVQVDRDNQSTGSSTSADAVKFVQLGVAPTQVLEVIQQDYVRTSRAKGLPERAVYFRHALRNALIPLATILGPTITGLIGGAVIIETIWSWPGMGRLFVNANFQRDYPVILAGFVVGAIAVILGNLLSDILYGVIDPRVRLA